MAARQCVCVAVLILVAIKLSNVPACAAERADHAAKNDYQRALKEAMDDITAQEVNAVHVAILDKMIYRAAAGPALRAYNKGAIIKPGPVIVQNGGDQFVGGQHVEGRLGMPLHWDIVGDDDLVLFTMWLSLRKTDETVTEVTGKNGRVLYVNVVGAAEKALDLRPKKLEGLSIRDVVQLLDKRATSKM
jgi:hypothetical protein